MPETPPQEHVAEAILRQLVRKGIFDRDDTYQMMTEAAGQTKRDIAACLAEAEAPSRAQFDAEHRRRQFRVVEPDGGNEQT